MRFMAAVAGAFLASALMLVIVDIYTPGYNLINPPLFVIFLVIWCVGFGYATIEANLKKKIIAVLVIEGLALTGSSLYFMFTRGISEYIFGLVLGVSAIIIMILFGSKKE